MIRNSLLLSGAAALFTLTSCLAAGAAEVLVTVTNLSPSTSIGFSPLIASAHDGTVDQFDNGAAASAGVEGVAELGSGATLMAEIAAQQASAVTGMALNPGGSAGPLLPGASQSVLLSGLDTTANRYFSFLSMAVPSNDAFVGNDDPMAIELFDAAGDFVAVDFTLNGSAIWDAGTEVNALAGALFIQGVDGAVSPAENGTIFPADLDTIFDFYVGETTGPGYVFSGGPAAATPVLAISFTAVPEPSTFALAAGGLAMAWVRRRR